MKLITDKMMLVNNAGFNPLFSCLSEQTITRLIFDHAKIVKFRPGELVCQMSKKSVLNDKFLPLFGKTENSYMTKNLTMKKIDQNIDFTLNRGEHAKI